MDGRVYLRRVADRRPGAEPERRAARGKRSDEAPWPLFADVGEAGRFETFYQRAPCGYHSLDAHGRFLSVNDTELRWLGYTRDELLGQPFSRILSPASAERFAENLPRFLAAGRIEDVEYDLIRKDGATLTVLVNATALRRPDGSFVASHSVMTDITARKQAEEALRASEERYRRLYEATPVMLHSIDAEGRLVSVSDLWLTTMGYTRDEVLGRRSTEFLTPESRVRAREVLPRFFREGFCKDVPYQLVRRDGTLIDVRLSATAEHDAEGRVTRSLAVMTDVTDQLRAQRELAEYRAHLEDLVEARTAELAAANRELESFSFSVSHDLRAPLRAILGFSQALEAGHGDALAPAGRDLLRRIQAAAVRQGQLIDDLLRLARTGRGEMRIETVDVAAIARAVGAELAAAHPNRRVELVVEDLPPARADAELLRILLENVLANAWKFTAGRDVAHVRVSAERTEEGVVYRVTDDGAGFEMARAGRLFSPFERLHAQTEFPGTGLGLAIVARIAARHGGRAWAEGAVGKGATVSFTLG